jgi:predicted nucleic acid-binding protein
MIFLDANFFLRFLTVPADDFSARAQGQAKMLLAAVRDGAETATTTELVLHEVCFVLTSKRHYGYASADAIQVVRPLLRYRSLRLGPGEKEIILRALEIWEQDPKLEFADSAIAARCEANGWELATFDERLGSLPSVTRWQPTDPT